MMTSDEEHPPAGRRPEHPGAVPPVLKGRGGASSGRLVVQALEEQRRAELLLARGAQPRKKPRPAPPPRERGVLLWAAVVFTALILALMVAVALKLS